MSKVICELCGSIYSDTETQCPTCGTEKPVTAGFVDEVEDTSAARPYTPVKGGRFSKSNVNKRAKAAGIARPSQPVRQAPKKNRKKKNSDRGLVIAIILLLVAIGIVLSYIYIKYFHPGTDGNSVPPKDTQSAQHTPQDTKDTTPKDTDPKDTQAPTTGGDTEPPQEIPCTDLQLAESLILLNKAGNSWLLNVIPTPANTTDPITFASSNEAVATVTEEGAVVAVASGEAVITITCGDAQIQCKVRCDIAPSQGTQDTQPQDTKPEDTKPEETKPEDTQPQDTAPAGDFKFNTKYGDEVTLNVGESWFAYKDDIDPDDVTWSVGNTSVATVTNGKVKAVGKGSTTLYAVYNGVEYKCLIRVS